ncbi:MAG: tetratricopeptide repeat protein [Chloracidobacterium sp.]|nr:tetratricopeptide repeat protein [Chloracidobacterium sp.]MCO5332399.1 tetratricopeptide repeat protein [Pyrinomonadaceae bacterium]
MNIRYTLMAAAIFACFVTVSAVNAQNGRLSPKPTPKPTPRVMQPQPQPAAAPPAKAVEFYNQGKAFWKSFDISDAIEALTKAIEIHPNYIDALSERGTIYFLTRKHQLAVNDLDKVLAAQPNNTKMLHYRGMALTELAVKTKDDDNDRKTAGDIAQRALADLSKAIEISPSEFPYYNSRGKLLLEFSFYKESITDFDKSIAIKANGVALAHRGLAKYYLDDTNAIDDLNQAVKIAPDYPDAFYIRGTVHRDNGKLRDALLDLDEAIRLAKYNEKYFNTRGMLYFRLQDGYMAVADFTNAIKEKPDYATAYFNRAVTYKRFPYSVSTDGNAIDKIRLQHTKMLEDLSAAIRYKPNFDAALVERGLIYSTDMRNKSTPDAETIQRLKLALSDFEQAIKHNPKNADAYNGRASVNDDLGKKDLALADYTKAIALDPTLATAYMGRMAIYCEQGKKDLSIADEKKVRELGLAVINVCNLGGK